jgi:hypothetical protein
MLLLQRTLLMGVFCTQQAQSDDSNHQSQMPTFLLLL